MCRTDAEERGKWEIGRWRELEALRKSGSPPSFFRWFKTASDGTSVRCLAGAPTGSVTMGMASLCPPTLAGQCACSPPRTPQFLQVLPPPSSRCMLHLPYNIPLPKTAPTERHCVITSPHTSAHEDAIAVGVGVHAHACCHLPLPHDRLQTLPQRYCRPPLSTRRKWPQPQRDYAIRLQAACLHPLHHPLCLIF